ncbi:MAG TPA: four-carbon acid sugar kinase family protein [Acetobacteraceae bacterium]|nr:four-carbon acid sugar kinase family protein [Acetobacteraceae bacterium]
MPQILVVADDLSGAADCGIAFRRAGLSSIVLFSGDAVAGNADALALDADSRHLPAPQAAERHVRLVQRHLAPGVLFYKKIDSTLRGNIGAELAAIIPSAGVAIVAPAFPDTGRTTRNGRVYVRNVPLEQTETWRHEGLTGVADIATMLEQSGVRPAQAGLDLVRGDPAAFCHALDDMARGGAGAIVCDAETDGDLAAIAAASAQMRGRRFWVGSAGLARHLPKAAGMTAAPSPAAVIEPHGPVLVVVGSVSEISRAQVRHLAGQSGIVAVAVPPDTLRHGEADQAWQAAASAIEAALDRNDDVVLTIGADGSQDLSEGWLLCDALARLVLPMAVRIGGLVATGGETARALLTALGAAGLRLVCEIEPGVVLSTAEGGRALPVITKAGAFGTPETLQHCRAVLRGPAPAGTGS